MLRGKTLKNTLEIMPDSHGLFNNYVKRQVFVRADCLGKQYLKLAWDSLRNSFCMENFHEHHLVNSLQFVMSALILPSVREVILNILKNLWSSVLLCPFWAWAASCQACAWVEWKDFWELYLLSIFKWSSNKMEMKTQVTKHHILCSLGKNDILFC